TPPSNRGPAGDLDRVDADPREPQPRDAPLPVGVAPVLLVVVAVAAQAHAAAVGRGRELHVVLHRPDPTGRVRSGQLDLGHVAVVHGAGALEGRAHLVHDRGAA